MVDNRAEELDLVFHALSDSTRRQMLSRLAKGECTISELAAPHDLTFAGISKHLKVLESAHFVEKTKDGRTYRCRANLAPLASVEALLEELGSFWRMQLDALERFVTSEDFTEEKNDGTASKRKQQHPKGRSKKTHPRKTR